MATELPVYSIVAMATVTASLIAATVSFVNFTLTLKAISVATDYSRPLIKKE